MMIMGINQKNFLILLALILAIISITVVAYSIIPITVVANPGCLDSDGGLQRNTKGTCNDDMGGPYTDSCNWNDARVREYYCSGVFCDDTYLACGDNCCSGGKCDAGISASCSETDGGDDEDVKGTCSSCGNSFTDQCNAAQTKVQEYSCSGNHCEYTYIDCGSNCCVGGECNPATFTSCSDSDGGDDRYEAGSCLSSCTTEPFVDKCNWNDARVKEYSCSGDVCDDTYLACGDNCCSGGKCDAGISASCSETDGGADKDVKGTCSSCGNSFDDRCNAANTKVREYSCTDNHCEYDYIDCPAGCTNGKCNPVGGPVCGDGTTEGGEECDPPEADSSDCSCSSDGCVGDDYYNYPSSGDCTSSCACDVDDGSGDPCEPNISYDDPLCTAPGPVCGDGTTEGGEECDPPEANSSECSCRSDRCIGDDYYNYPSRGDCTGSCSCDTSRGSGDPCEPNVTPDDPRCAGPAPVCGDGSIGVGEECDPPEADSSDCSCPSDGCVGTDFYNYSSYGDCTGSCACDVNTDVGEPCEPNISYDDPLCGGPPPPPGPFRLRNPLTLDSPEEIIGSFIDIIFYITIGLIPLMIIYAGFLFITSRGDVSQIERAKRIIIGTVVGVVIILLSKAILSLIGQLLGT